MKQCPIFLSIGCDACMKDAPFKKCCIQECHQHNFCRNCSWHPSFSAEQGFSILAQAFAPEVQEAYPYSGVDMNAILITDILSTCDKWKV